MTGNRSSRWTRAMVLALPVLGGCNELAREATDLGLDLAASLVDEVRAAVPEAGVALVPAAEAAEADAQGPAPAEATDGGETEGPYADASLVELLAPSMRWSGPATPYARERGDASVVARPFWFNAPVYQAPDARRRVVGVIRRNTVLPISHRVRGKGCKTGAWYRLVGGGYVCRADGFAIKDELEPLPVEVQNARPGSESPLPFIYAKVRRGDPPLYWRLPTAAERDAQAEEPIRERSTGAHFAAVEQFVEHEGHAYARTVRGFFVAVEDLEFLDPPRMSGELLDDDRRLPIAFVHEQFAPVHDPESLEVVGWAERYARDMVEEEVSDAGTDLVRLAEGHLVPRASVRIARTVPRPDGVGRDDQWVAVDLDEQTLVAYEGDTPVMATMVASGKPGYEPPLGLFQIEKKYLTKTMEGPDDVAGTYRVEQVPWTMYYWGSLALHGAYWHDGFGKARSHGCTNIPPVDARWLFQWAGPALPTGWHGAVRLDGPHVYVMRSSLTARRTRG